MRGLNDRRAVRDASLGTAALAAAVWLGSAHGARLDPALLGYLGATLVACFGVVHRLSGFWRRPASAFYARAALAAVRRPRTLRRFVRAAVADLAAQRFVARRGHARWIAHLALSLGTLASFAITLPLVWGWLGFEALGAEHYRVRLAGIPAGRFAIDGPLGWLAFHALALAAVAVAGGASYFLASRVRAGHTAVAHVAPLALLLAVAVSGLALPATHDHPLLFDVAAVVHETTVVLLLVALPASKLSHVLVRPLQLGARVVRAPDADPVRCARCGDPLAPAAQLAAVERLLADAGIPVGEHARRCSPCRRRLVPATQATLLGAAFQPRVAGAHPASPRVERAA